MTEVVIYTDGACSRNPGPGGWGAVLRWKDTEKEMHGGDPLTTNNRMELMAAIQALEALQRPAKVDLYTDSKYLLDGITKWIKGWQRNGWLTAAKKPVKNADLWRRLTDAMSPHDVTWTWAGRCSDSSAWMAAISSIRLFVVCGSPPYRSFSVSCQRSTTPQPPGPGLPLHAPSV